MIKRPEIKGDIPIVFFDGAKDLSKHLCGAGFLIHISKSHFLHCSLGVGFGTNVFIELVSLWGAMQVAHKFLHLKKLNIFGDSLVVIRWIIMKAISAISFWKLGNKRFGNLNNLLWKFPSPMYIENIIQL